MDGHSRDISPRQMSFRRNSSSGRHSYTDSWRRGSFNLSRDGSYRNDDVPDEYVAQVGDAGDQVVDDGSGMPSSSVIDEEGLGIRQRENSSRKLGRRLSWKMGSGSFNNNTADEINEDLESKIDAQAGDSGDKVIGKDHHDGSASFRSQMDNIGAFKDDKVIIPGGALGQSPHQDDVVHQTSSLYPSKLEAASPLPTDPMMFSDGSLNVQNARSSSFKEKQYKLPHWADYLTYLLHLAVFGILGVLTRYFLKKLLGHMLSLSIDETPLHPDILANMAGSFLMGWFGVVFKEDVRHVSEHLAVGITTGYMGSLTTFSGWNQKMVELSSRGHWGYAVAGIIFGICVVDRSIDMGVWTAERVKVFLLRKFKRDLETGLITPATWKIDRPKRHIVMTVLMLLALGCLWGSSGGLARRHLDEISNGAQLWLGLIVGPPGVWSRWYLARLNGRGFGRSGFLRWLPVGTLTANVLAACLMASLSTISKAVGTVKCGIIVGAMQLGFLGCLSTVSTFAVELYAMRRKEKEGRALAYVVATFLTSFVMGTLLYSVPVWTKHY